MDTPNPALLAAQAAAKTLSPEELEATIDDILYNTNTHDTLEQQAEALSRAHEALRAALGSH